jgi:hypothetical protein
VDAADPSERLLRKRQDKYYGPLLRWWAGATGAPLATAVGLAELAHPPAAHAAAADFCELADPLLRAATASVLGAVKSSVIALAFAHRELDIDGAAAAARVEEEWQIAENGLVEDGHDTARAREAALQAEVELAKQRAADAERRAKEEVERKAAADAAAEKAETARREADRTHKATINRTALAALVKGGVSEDVGKLVLKLIVTGAVPAVSIHY